MAHFTVSDKSNIIIYGAAHLGKEALYRLNNKGFKVECFLDRRADELIEVEGVKVIRAEDYSGDKKNAIVIMGVSNPMSVANRLYQLGFNKMIFKVVQWQNLPSDIQAISDAFQYLMNGKGSIGNIPCYDPSMDIRFINNAVVRADSQTTVARIPLDMLFVKSSDRQVYTYSGLLSYIKAFSLERKDSFGMLEDYSNKHAVEKFNGWLYDLSGEERRSYTLATLNELNLNLDFGMKYFDENPIAVTFEGNKFYIEDKYLFRVMFFVSKGILHIPAEMSNTDYEAWLNEPMLNDAVEYAKKYDLFTSYSMIEHPCLYNFPTARDIGGNSRFVKIGNHIEDVKLEMRGLKIVDVGAYYGVMSRFFARMGAQVTSVEMNRDEYGFEVELNKLLHFDNIEMFCGVIQDLKTDKKFDMAILMNVLHWHLETGIAADIVRSVDRITTKYLLHESGDEPEREKTIIRENSSFKNYIHVCTTVGTGKIRELGFWIK